MKSINPPPLYFISNPLRIVKEEISSVTQSPYLRALLSGKTSLSKNEDQRQVENPDRMAASRYIRDSRFLRSK